MLVNSDKYPEVLREKDERRFWSKVDKQSECWIWTAGVTPSGYGSFKLLGKNTAAHRLAYTITKGAIPNDLVLDHICRNRLCVNPDHLEIVTQKVNILRGAGPSASNDEKTHCPRNHPLEKPNLILSNLKRGARECVACSRTRSKYTNAKLKGVVLNPDLFQEISDEFYKNIQSETN